MSIFSSYTETVIFFGPHIQGNEVAFYRNYVKPTLIVGDGKNEIKGDDLDLLYDFIQKAYVRKPQGKVLVILDCHGTFIDNGNKLGSLSHFIQVGVTEDNLVIPARHLLEGISRATGNKPIDILYLPCDGKAVLPDLEVLPYNSRVIAFSERDKYTYAMMHEFVFKNLNDNIENLKDFYKAYLYFLDLNEKPILVSVGQERVLDFFNFEVYFSKTYDEDVKLYVFDQIKKQKIDEALQYDSLNNIFNKITQYQSISDNKMSYCNINAFFKDVIELENMETVEMAQKNIIGLISKYDLPFDLNFERLLEVVGESDENDQEDNLSNNLLSIDGECSAWYKLLRSEASGDTLLFAVKPEVAIKPSIYGQILYTLHTIDEYYHMNTAVIAHTD